MQGIIDFFTTIIDGIRQIIEMMTTGVEYMQEILSMLPPVVLIPLGIIITVLVLYVILGRGS